MGECADRQRAAVRQHQGRADVALEERGHDLDASGLEPLGLEELDLDGAREGVALVGGVLARRLGELVDEGVGEPLEAGEVVTRDGHGEVVGCEQPADPHPAAEVHLAQHPVADLDGLHRPTKRHSQRSFHQSLEAILDASQAHDGRNPTFRPVLPPRLVGASETLG